MNFVGGNNNLVKYLSYDGACHMTSVCPPSLVGKGGHTLLLRGGRLGFDSRQLQRTKRAFYPPLAMGLNFPVIPDAQRVRVSHDVLLARLGP